jgi:hypothetical protein
MGTEDKEEFEGMIHGSISKYQRENRRLALARFGNFRRYWHGSPVINALFAGDILRGQMPSSSDSCVQPTQQNPGEGFC